MNINWKVLTAQVSAVTGAFAAGGALFGVIPGRSGLIVTAVAGGVNAFLPRVQQAAGVLQSIKQHRMDGKSGREEKLQVLLKPVVEREVDAALKTLKLQRTDKGLVPIDEAPASIPDKTASLPDSAPEGSGIPNVAGTGEEVIAPQDDKPAVVQGD